VERAAVDREADSFGVEGPQNLIEIRIQKGLEVPEEDAPDESGIQQL
jgi:hypothetical protein